MPKVKFLKSHPSYGHFAGDVAEVKEAAELLKSGHVELVNDDADTAAKAEAKAKAAAEKAAKAEAAKTTKQKATAGPAKDPNAEKATE